jgi:hypothetical protein
MPALRTPQPLFLAPQVRLHPPLDLLGLLILVALPDSERMIRYCFDFNEFLGGAWNGGVE